MTKVVPTAIERADDTLPYTEYLFDQEVDLDDHELMALIAQSFGHSVSDQDWRDPLTLWVWHND
jgi:hypothetical protein